jgi:NAD(P)-dependent dehydrogenase (short-subunit alcohol dehydrogenase family)
VDVDGKVALVTGGATGIGRASAFALARAGALVMVADVDAIEGTATARMIDETIGGRASFVQADVSYPHGIREMFTAVEVTFGGVDIVHNNAGVVSGEPMWPDMDLERIRHVVDVNLAGVAMGTQAAIHALRRRGGGAIVNTSSTTALNPFPADPVYGATKAAVVHLTRSCAPLAAEGIRVNAVLPGMTRTPIIDKTGDGTRPAAWLAPVIPTMRLIEPEEVAAAVIALVVDDTVAGEIRVVANRAS